MSNSVATSSCDCPLCNFSSPSRGLWLSHLRSVHSKDNDFFISCDINGCGSSYSRCASFVSHIYRQHREIIMAGQLQNSPVVSYNDCGEDRRDIESFELMCSEPLRSDLQHAVDQLLQTADEEQKKKAALYILNLKEIRGLSQVAIDNIVQETQKVFNHSFGRIKAGVDECLSRSSIVPDESLAADLDHLFVNAKDPFEGLHSTYLQESYYRCHLGCMVCCN